MNRINVLSYLDEIYENIPDKVAFASDESSLTFLELYENSLSLGTYLAEKGLYKKPIIVYMKKSPDMINAFLGIIRAGCHYVPIDDEMPEHRINLICDTLKPEFIICDSSTKDAAIKLIGEDKIAVFRDICTYDIEFDVIESIRENTIDTDPIYIVFTSGSTGIPKGVAACHRSVIDYIENLSDVLQVSENTVFGNQAPLYVDACLKDIYPTLKFGASTRLIPKQLFMFPVKLIEYLNEHKINTICWVAPALSMVSGFGTFKTVVPEYLNTVAFVSELFPTKQFNTWKRTLPECRFINLYGPTEITGVACYYEAAHEFPEDELIPIGRPFSNTRILLLNEANEPVNPGETGEICILGTSLALGYYNDFQRTDAVFVQNPLNKSYHELMYRTGDLGRYNEQGELVFLSRKDYQIKHMGHRIELGEIEMMTNQNSSIQSSCCIFDDESKKIILYFVGSCDEKELLADLKNRLPRYMVPNIIRRIDVIPLTSNGKTNKLKLKEIYKQESK